MSDQKGFTVFKLLLFLFSIAAIGLFVYGALMQPIFKNSGEKYYDFVKYFLDNFMNILNSSEKDKLFPISITIVLILLLGGAILFTVLGALVVLISGLVSLFSSHRLNGSLTLVAGSFHLAFISILISYFYPLEKMELGLGGLLIVGGLGLAIVIYALEDLFYGNNKTIRRGIGTFARIAISGGFIYLSLFCFKDLFRITSETEGFGQYVFSHSLYLSRIDESLPKKLFAFAALGTFYVGLVANIMIPLLPAICGTRSIGEKYVPKNRNKKFIAQTLVMAILLSIAYFGSIFSSESPKDYAMGTGLLIMLAVLVAAFALSIVMAIVDPKTKIKPVEVAGPANLQ